MFPRTLVAAVPGTAMWSSEELFAFCANEFIFNHSVREGLAGVAFACVFAVAHLFTLLFPQLTDPFWHRCLHGEQLLFTSLAGSIKFGKLWDETGHMGVQILGKLVSSCEAARSIGSSAALYSTLKI